MPQSNSALASVHSRHLKRFSKNRPVQSSSRLARRPIFSHRIPMNQDTLLRRRRSLATSFLSRASCSTFFASGLGKASEKHLASLVMVNQRRTTSSGVQRLATRGIVRSIRWRWLLSSARNSMSMANKYLPLLATCQRPTLSECGVATQHESVDASISAANRRGRGRNITRGASRRPRSASGCCGLGERRCESLSWARPRTDGRPYSRGSAAKRGSPLAMHGRPSRPKNRGRTCEGVSKWILKRE